MRKLRALMGMPVVCGNRRLGRVLRAELAEDLKRLDGIWISAGLMGTRYIPAEELEMLGQVAVMADSAGSRRRLNARPLLVRAVSTDGRRLGAITSAEIDELTFAVTSLELSMGLWDDLLARRARVMRYALNRSRGEVVIDLAGNERREDEHEERMDERPGHGHADRRVRGDGVWRHELADGETVEPQGEADGQLDL